MKQFLLTIFLSILTVPLFGQIYNSSNSLSRIGINYYVQDENGFFHKQEYVNLDKVVDPISTYAYDKKTQDLYLITKTGNCVVRVNEALAKYFKKSKTVPMLKEKDLLELISIKNKDLEAKFDKYNSDRQKYLNDSIERAFQDSLKKAKDDSIKQANEILKELNYRKNHDWSWVPTRKCQLFCVVCEKTITTRDSSLCYAIKNDSIFWADRIEGDLGLTYRHIHAAEVPKVLKNNFIFKYHYNVYRDSLENSIPLMSKLYAGIRDYMYYEEYLDVLKKRAPHGYFLDWSWDCEYSSISFSFKYLNTNKKTIKYIDVYWTLKNDVGDVRKTGHFSGTGPLEEWESATWSWDHSSYYASGDASKMSLSKVIITYMDGTKVTIPKDKIWYN